MFDLFNDTIFKILQNASKTYEKLDANSCIREYAKEFVTTRRNLILVSTTTNSEYSTYHNYEGLPSDGLLNYNWMCYPVVLHCTTARIGNGPTSWMLGWDNTNQDQVKWLPPQQVDYCLSEKVEENRKFQFSLYIIIIIICYNMAKSVSMEMTI